MNDGKREAPEINTHRAAAPWFLIGLVTDSYASCFYWIRVCDSMPSVPALSSSPWRQHEVVAESWSSKKCKFLSAAGGDSPRKSSTAGKYRHLVICLQLWWKRKNNTDADTQQQQLESNSPLRISCFYGEACLILEAIKIDRSVSPMHKILSEYPQQPIMCIISISPCAIVDSQKPHRGKVSFVCLWLTGSILNRLLRECRKPSTICLRDIRAERQISELSDIEDHLQENRTKKKDKNLH